jgi:hypothetical protein
LPDGRYFCIPIIPVYERAWKRKKEKGKSYILGSFGISWPIVL